MIPRWFILFILGWLTFDLRRALNAPIRNADNITWINDKIAE